MVICESLLETTAVDPAPQEGKAATHSHCHRGSGELLTLTGETAGQWKENFEDLLNPTDTQRKQSWRT